MSFKDKVVLVTGATFCTGAAIAIKFSEEGAKVAIVGRNESKLKNVSAACEQSGSKPLLIIADISKDNDVKRILSDTINFYEKLDVLVNNTEISGAVSILDERAVQVFDQVMATNLRSAIYITNLATPHLIKTKGNIINISSIASSVVLSGDKFSYCASKAGLDHLTKCVALELEPKGVRVNAINPGHVQSDFLQNNGASAIVEAFSCNDMKKATTSDRVAVPEKIADLVLFLASNKAESVTGATLFTK